MVPEPRGNAGRSPVSLKLLEDGYAKFVTGRFLQTLEYRPDRFPEQPMAGPFFANMGGLLLSLLLLGFPILRIDAGDLGGWVQGEIVLPKGWEAIEVDRLWVRGRPTRLRARHGYRAELKACRGELPGSGGSRQSRALQYRVMV